MRSNRLWSILISVKLSIREVMFVLDKKQRRVFIHWLMAQLSLVILDFLALIFTAVVTSVFIPIVQSKPKNIPKSFIQLYETFLPSISIYEFIFVLVAISGALVILRALLSILINRHYFYKAAQIQVQISDKLIDNHFGTKLDSRLPLTQSQLIQALTTSLNSLVTYVMANIVIVSAELISISLLILSLVIYLPLMGLAMGILGMTYMLIVTTVIIRSSTQANRMNALNELQAMEDLIDISVSHDESRMLGSFNTLRNRYLLSRLRYSISLAERQIQFQYPKVALEIGAVILGMILSTLVWYFFGIRQSVTFLALFAVLGLRIQPGVSRVQNCLIMVRQHLPLAQPIVEMNKFYSSKRSRHGINLRFTPMSNDREIRISIEDLSYGDFRENFLFRNLNFKFAGPGLVLLKGPNGSGKSTLLEIMCGFRDPLQGELEFEIFAAEGETQNQENAIAYLPQDIAITHNDLYENISLGSTGVIDLKMARIYLNGFEFLEGNWHLEEKRNYGSELSGGEKQKIGLARVFAHSSPIMILDEPTTALDIRSIEFLKSLIVDRKDKSLIIVTSHTKDFDDIADAVIVL
jgi:ABC-type transport system involved in cytochrome bd biosynthesis fused ATPase/permease subunit